MMNAIRRISTCGVVLSIAIVATAATAQTAPVTALDRQLAKITFAVSGLGQFSTNTAGITYLPQYVTQSPSNTLGALVELRYERSKLIGIEFNYTYARYTENYNVNNTAGTPSSQLPYVLGVQSKVNEYSMGYVAHGPRLFGLQPFGGAGLGAIEFKPTKGGGQGLPPEVRTGIYYAIGVEQSVISEHFGLRVQFRQLFFGAPDFNENYLANGQRSYTIEPGAGFYLRF